MLKKISKYHKIVLHSTLKICDKPRAVTCTTTEFQLWFHVPCNSACVCVLPLRALKKASSRPCN